MNEPNDPVVEAYDLFLSELKAQADAKQFYLSNSAILLSQRCFLRTCATKGIPNEATLIAAAAQQVDFLIEVGE